MEQLDYREQAKAVRAAAQARLRQLRDERRAKSRSNCEVDTPLTEEAGEVLGVNLEVSPALRAMAIAAACEGAAKTDTHVETGAFHDTEDQFDEMEQEASGEISGQECELEVGEEPDNQTNSPLLGSEQSEHPADDVSALDSIDDEEKAFYAALPQNCDAEPAKDAEDEFGAVDPVTEGQNDPSDLGRLPGVGHGLIWALQQQGVYSLHDLANADPDDLTNRLDLIGQLIDMGSWIAYAQQSLAGD